MKDAFKKLLKASKSSVVQFERSLAHFSHSPIPGIRVVWGVESGIWKDDSCACGIAGIPRIMADLEPEMMDATPWEDPEGEVSNLPVGGLWDAILECAPYASIDKTRLALNGVHIGTDGVVATDGHRINFVAGNWASHLTHDERHIIVPSSVIKMAKPLAKSLSTFRIYTKVIFNEAKVWSEEKREMIPTIIRNELHSCMMNFVSKDGTIFSASWACVDNGPFPQYRMVIPKQSSSVVEVDLEAMRAAVSKAMPFASKNTRQIVLTPSYCGWVLEVQNHDLGINEYQHCGLIQVNRLDSCANPPRIGFNVDYLSDAIGKKAKTARFSLNMPTQAVKIDKIGTHDESNFKILMPLRIVD